MAVERVGDMSVEELKALIDQRIEERGIRVLPKRSDGRSMREILESIARNRITPPPGSKSALELLREDRDR